MNPQTPAVLNLGKKLASRSSYQLVWAALLALALSACAANSSTQTALELAAVMDIKSIQTAEVQYSAQFGRFAVNLSELKTADLIPSDLAAGEKGGYRFTLTGHQKGFVINARPKTYNETGRKSFYSDETLVIRVNAANEPATASSPEFGK